MTTDSKDTKKIRELYKRMRTKEDFLVLLNFIRTIIFEKHQYEIELKQLNYYISNNSRKRRYKRFLIPKKTGGYRAINSPQAGLKVIQSCISTLLSTLFTPHESSFGFVASKSIADNAALHINSAYVFNIDLNNFFPSIPQARIWSRLQHPPFNLNEKHHRKDLANIIATLVCCEHTKGNFALPQGSPASPIISNIIANRLDFYLTAVAKRFGCKYSRYADDITFSSMFNLFSENGDLRNEISRIVVQEGFSINDKKTRLQSSFFKQEVTGLVVNKRINVNRNYIKEIRKWLYLCETYGVHKAHEYFSKDYNKPLSTPNILAVLKGKLSFLKMVRGVNDPLTKKLEKRFKIISKKEIEKPKKSFPKLFLGRPTLHHPSKLVSYLKKFSENGSELKYTTHIWDSNDKNLKLFLENISKEYESFSFELKALHEPLNAKIFNFLLNPKVGENGWGIHRVKFGWNSPELLALCAQQKRNFYPGDIVIPQEYQFQAEDKTIQKFSQVIDLFKNEIEIRDEQDRLYSILVNLYDKHLQDFRFPTFKNFSNVNFFTDVQWLSEALEIILCSFKTRSQYPNLAFEIIVGKKNTIELHLEQVDSFNSGKSYHDEKLSIENGDLGSLFKKLKNLCDWSIESKFKEGEYRINYLVSDIRTQALEKISVNSGFKHILRFYK